MLEIGEIGETIRPLYMDPVDGVDTSDGWDTTDGRDNIEGASRLTGLLISDDNVSDVMPDISEMGDISDTIERRDGMDTRVG